MAELQRASVFAIKEETTVGDLISPASGSDFIPLREGFAITSEVEALESDELVNDIGRSKGQLGKESPNGTHGIYLKNSETEGSAPEWALLLESALGAKTVNATEYSVTAGSSAGTDSARAALEMASDEEDNFEIGQGVLIKDGTNGYSVRNVYNVDSAGDQLDLNFNLGAAPASGVSLGKAQVYKPAATGHPSYSVWMYTANGAAIQAAAGCRTASMSVTLTAAQQAEAEFSYAGTEFFYDPIEITATSKYLDFTDDGGTVAAVLEEKIYKSPVALASALATAMNAVATDTITVEYKSNGADAGKYVIANTSGAVLSLLWSSGANTANTVGAKIGFSVAADDTGSLSYTSDSVISLAAPFTPSYDNATNVVVKNAELMIGDFNDNICREASAVSFTIDTPQTDVDDLCEESGLAEKLILERTVTMTANLILKRHEAELFDKFINNSDVSVMMNVGAKDSSGNWVAGKVVNMYMANATLTAHATSGDDVVSLDVTATGYVDSTRKDIYFNFL